MREFPPHPDDTPSARGPGFGRPEVEIISVREPNDANRQVAASPRRSGILLSKFAWLAMTLIFLVVVSLVGPHIVERYQYAIERGRQRATYERQVADFEVAREALKGSPLKKMSVYYQMVTKRVTPSVVHINTTVKSNDKNDSDDERPIFPHRFEGRGQGTGVIVDAEGYIVTNFHVVEGASEIMVTLSDNRRVEGRLIGRDEQTDLAVVKIDEERIVPADWGDSEAVEVGSLVWAVGSPFGLQHTVTMGILSAKNRAGSAGTVYQNFLQTDAAVNPGNSGGPLVDVEGRVIGINTAIVGQTYQGISFAVPSNVAKIIYRKIKKNGYVSRGWLGVQMQELTNERASELGLANVAGVLVVDLPELPGLPSPARTAGIRTGDVLLRWNGTPVDSPKALIRQVADTDVGTTADVIVLREGKELEFKVAVGQRPDSPR